MPPADPSTVSRPFILEFNAGRFFQLLQSLTEHANAPDGPTLFPAACWMVYDGSLRLGPQATVAEPLARWIHSQSGSLACGNAAEMHMAAEKV
ncbi:hypothetical protein PCANC_23466 [Puccinia coronata f. sp. avenae]|uniref:Uncharacterized protein n=1 Tax=Puccinia coronata f. sp. avenae TaxID=200324 RepID=A0A2N5TUE2_9BASI|nr:hypothetical protein PCANC_23466 [Puccinia coronata f. sp. avenae]